MIRTQDAHVGTRVVWRSLDPAIPEARGTITKVTARQAFIACDDFENLDTWLDSGASCWHVLPG